MLTDRYGADSIPDTMTIQDWPVSYDDVEPYYDRFEKRFLRCVRPGRQSPRQDGRGRQSLRGAARRRIHPNNPIKTAVAPAMFGTAAQNLGYHPFPTPTATSEARLM